MSWRDVEWGTRRLVRLMASSRTHMHKPTARGSLTGTAGVGPMAPPTSRSGRAAEAIGRVALGALVVIGVVGAVVCSAVDPELCTALGVTAAIGFAVSAWVFARSTERRRVAGQLLMGVLGAVCATTLFGSHAEQEYNVARCLAGNRIACNGALKHCLLDQDERSLRAVERGCELGLTVACDGLLRIDADRACAVGSATCADAPDPTNHAVCRFVKEKCLVRE